MLYKMRTVFEGILFSSNQGWKFLPLDGTTEYPVGAYFTYQQKVGPPIAGGTQPIWSYDLTKVLNLWKQYGGYVFNENGNILRK